MKRICVVIGTRPEAIKMAPVVLALKQMQNQGHDLEVCVCLTAQHRQMADQVLALFNIKPDFDLDVMHSKQDLTDVTSRILVGLRDLFKEYQPTLVLVHGDTTTTFSASLSAFYHRIPVAHVEAGLRTGNIYSPWPEEINRRLTSSIAYYHFAPTEEAKNNLLRESIESNRILVTGNTVIDALFHAISILESDDDIRKQIEQQFSFLKQDKRMILITGHRRENFGSGFENICQALKLLSKRSDIQLVYPVHLNPNVKEPVQRILAETDNIHLIEPLDYLPFVYLMKRAYLILTDSGGIQEEAPSLGKPVLVMRETSERPEGIASGKVRLVGTNKEKIISEIYKLLDDKNIYKQMAHSINPYGNGKAATLIANFLTQN
jgi:UDP-N-acetylglucosamine 2-epimerase (non-hydrolysing)